MNDRQHQKVVYFKAKQTKKTSTTDDNKSIGEVLSSFDQSKLDLRMLMDWPVTSRSYTITAKDEKVRADTLFITPQVYFKIIFNLLALSKQPRIHLP